MRVSFVGSGNLAWHLAPALDNAGYIVGEVYSRNIKNAEVLIDRLYQAEVQDSLDFSKSQSSVFFIVAPDHSIEEITQEIILPEDTILVHTSGSMPMSILSYAATTSIGVFYPLQTFSKQKKINFSEVPIFIESENKHVCDVLYKMAVAIGGEVHVIDPAKRLTLHIAAVFASNFTNHMVTISKSILEANDLQYRWIKPLIAETFSKSLSLLPEKAQTGPAKRGDFEVLDKHIALLQNDEQLAELYKLISQHIIDVHGS